MQQPVGQTWNGGGTDFKWGGRAPLAPPLATTLIQNLCQIFAYLTEMQS